MSSERVLSGWGLFPSEKMSVLRPERYTGLRAPERPCIARGLGRSYGDAALVKGGDVVLMERLNRFLELDSINGILRVESGVSLREILDVIVPKGWFLKVTPGTTYATVGGCFAADVHGKNHHGTGSFCEHVLEIELVLADGSKVRCTPTGANAPLFWATAGGMGLTGIVTEVVLQLQKVETSWMVVEHIPTPDLDATLRVLSDPVYDAPYSVAWIDCLATGSNFGRSIVMNGRHASPNDLSLTVRQRPLHVEKGKKVTFPFHLPGFVLNRWTVGWFNSLYHKMQSRHKIPFVTSYAPYFYPLDAINDWNKMYGKRGFLQYQFVLPTATAREGMHVVLKELANSKRGSFLAVLKRFGKQNAGFLSFPMEGYTLALDLPINPSLFPFLDKMDSLLLNFGGRIYLAKDARMHATTFRTMYPRFGEWQAIKRQWDPHDLYSSDLARRLCMSEAL